MALFKSLQADIICCSSVLPGNASIESISRSREIILSRNASIVSKSRSADMLVQLFVVCCFFFFLDIKELQFSKIIYRNLGSCSYT